MLAVFIFWPSAQFFRAMFFSDIGTNLIGASVFVLVIQLHHPSQSSRWHTTLCPPGNIPPVPTICWGAGGPPLDPGRLPPLRPTGSDSTSVCGVGPRPRPQGCWVLLRPLCCGQARQDHQVLQGWLPTQHSQPHLWTVGLLCYLLIFYFYGKGFSPRAKSTIKYILLIITTNTKRK